MRRLGSVAPDRDHEPTSAPPRPVRVPAVVLLAVVCFGLLGLVYTELAPYGEAPDETNHADVAFALADGSGFASFDRRSLSAAVVLFCQDEIATTRACTLSTGSDQQMRVLRAADAPSRAQRPSFDGYGGEVPVASEPNQITHHSRVYYELIATPLRLERAITGGTWSMDQEWALLRVVNALLMAPLPLIAWWAAEQLRLRRSASLVAALLPFTCPQLLHIGATISVESLLIPLAGVVTALGCGMLRGDLRRRTALVTGVVLGLAVLAKPLALALVPFVVGAAVLGGRGRARLVARSLAFAGAATLAVSGWWFVGNLLDSGQLVPTIGPTPFRTGTTYPVDPLGFTRHFLAYLSWRFWGSFGWFSVSISAWAVALGSILVLGGLASAVVAAGRHRSPSADGRGVPRTAALLLLLAPVGLLFAFDYAYAWSLHRTSGRYPFIQGRYLFTGLVGMWLVVAAGLSDRLGGRRAPTVVLGVAVAMQGDAIARQLRGWWGGDGAGTRGEVQALAAWSAWSPWVLAAALGATAVSCWFLYRSVRRSLV